MHKLIRSVGLILNWFLWTLLLGGSILVTHFGSISTLIQTAKADERSRLTETGLILPNPIPQAASADGVWRDVNERKLQNEGGERFIFPGKYRVVAADLAALDRILAQAPAEGSRAKGQTTLLSLPLPDGSYGRFYIEAYTMMAPELAAKFPEIKTYLGWGLDDPSATIRLDRTPAGFHGLILSDSGTIYIDPYRRGDTVHYLSYNKEDYQNYWEKSRRETPPLPSLRPANELGSQDLSSAATDSGPARRTYRLAVAGTVEYTTFHGGKAAAQAAIVTTVNRINGVYEREVSVRLELVANNDSVVFEAEPDGYEDGNDTQMLDANITILDANIGNANYDMGHVFGVNGAGVAYLSSVCNNALKGGGVSQRNPPVGDPFDVDYAAHEMGHQFSANHSYNADGAGGCTTRNAGTAYEPASGVTIMSYVGICDTQDLQANAIPHFHAISFDEMRNFITDLGGGASCGTETATGNTPPIVEAGPNYTIPGRTPFMVTGSATDAEGNPLVYSWEEFDVPAAAWTDVGTLPNTDSDGQVRPIFRSYAPTGSPSRIFPSLASILDGTNSNIGEALPTINRQMQFRLTARDNLGGVAHDSMTVTVISTAGPFAVTEPNTAVTWTELTTQTVSWDVANTDDTNGVNCQNVKISLSANGGNSFPTVLAASTPNDGTEEVSVPVVPASTTARVKVECADQIFFDISNVNFTLVGTGVGDTNTYLPTVLK